MSCRKARAVANIRVICILCFAIFGYQCATYRMCLNTYIHDERDKIYCLLIIWHALCFRELIEFSTSKVGNRGMSSTQFVMLRPYSLVLKSGLFGFFFSVRTIFFSHNKSAETVFWLLFSDKRTGPVWFCFEVIVIWFITGVINTCLGLRFLACWFCSF